MQVALIAFTEHLYLVGDRGFANAGLLTLKTQDLSFYDLMPEDYLIQADGDELLLGKVQADADIGDLIHPFQQTTAKQEIIVIQMLG